ncbi:MAG: ketoacyl-ACP synthase III [Gammaproteobacteria bacterium]|nr:ketoacyl-ACP synthase III [Gammaproteobacteria bacterium]MDH3469285.1 ketoacyl-ACP synthase III [Gammaproteobacteria bacterium]
MAALRFTNIIGTGSYLPEKVLTNADLEAMVDTSHEWIYARTGISQRHIAADGETTCDLAEQAARRAVQAAQISTDSIDLIIVATTTADQVFPSTACLLQERLDIHGCPAFDVQAVCTGFIYALDIADKFIRTGNCQRALVVGAETFSRIIDWSDRGTCVLFGDGAGAVVVESGPTPGILSTHLHADGAYKDLLSVPVGISTGFRQIIEGTAYTQMQGSEVFKVAVRALGDVVEEALQANELDKDKIDWLVPHQANLRIINATAKRLGIPMQRVVVTVERHGNTSAASIPLAFDEAVRNGRIQRGQRVIFEGFGGGFTWGSILFTY